MPIIASDFKSVFSQLASGVTVITFYRQGRRHGFTATSLTPVSMAPPIALFCVGRSNDSHSHLSKKMPIGISILSIGQSEVSNRFATRTASERCEGIDTIEKTPGVPLLAGAIAILEGTIANLIPAGDHTVCLCDLERAEIHNDEAPLLYYSRNYHSLVPLPARREADREELCST